MTIRLTPELGIPFATLRGKVAMRGYRERAKALIDTLHLLEEHDALPVDATLPQPEDIDSARNAIMTEEVKVERQTPASVRMLELMLSEYDHELRDVHIRLRAYVTNKLIEETNNLDAKIRVKALELLGKRADVGLFAERVEHIQRNQTPEEIEAELQRRFDELMNNTVVSTQSATPEPKTLMDINLDEALNDGA